MSNVSLKLAVVRAAEGLCLTGGVDAITLDAVARAAGVGLKAVVEHFHDEATLVAAILERHQTAYERTWHDVLPTITSAREAIRLLVSTLANVSLQEDGGAAYVAIAAQMCTSGRFPLTGQPATTTPTALNLMSKLLSSTRVPFELMPVRFERFAVVLFSSVHLWWRQGAGRLSLPVFVEDLVCTLEFIALVPSCSPAPP